MYNFGNNAATIIYMAYTAQHTGNSNWLVKYKLYHIPFWLAYNYAWWAIQSSDPAGVVRAAFYSPYTCKFLFYVIFQAAAAYFNLYVLIPKFLEKGRYTAYVLSLIVTIVCAAGCIVPGYLLGAAVAGQSVKELYGWDDTNFLRILVGNPLQTTTASTTLAMSIKLTKNWVQSKKRQQLLEKEKLETELKFLKYQFNPHFLFNSINSIFFLIHKNPDMASSSLAKFSDLLRHQLYECNDNQISLGKEIAYLENFIELEKLRQNDNIQVSFNSNTTHVGHIMIAPFILMTFAENAFKHVSHYIDKPNIIDIQLTMEGNSLHFLVTNTTSIDKKAEAVQYGGIGLQNVQRRLDLLYRDKYQLTITNADGRFAVKLSLQLAQHIITPNLQTQPNAVLAAV